MKPNYSRSKHDRDTDGAEIEAVLDLLHLAGVKPICLKMKLFWITCFGAVVLLTIIQTNEGKAETFKRSPIPASRVLGMVRRFARSPQSDNNEPPLDEPPMDDTDEGNSDDEGSDDDMSSNSDESNGDDSDDNQNTGIFGWLCAWF
ncbi:hypothetical protein NPIL_538981 [Nephila pilipes]|uniref:Uncharacterized protein n=1 Tax=Nephila pilipes TaxID=299642 RepID=A0A8X6NZK7_NEPPI|nr:hypothetical protein NPIL_538981 [Nephila pilipes]